MIHVLILSGILLLLVLNQLILFLSPLNGILFAGVLVFCFLMLAMYDIYDIYAEDVLAFSSIIPLLSLLAVALQIQSPVFNTFTQYAILLIISISYYLFLNYRSDIFAVRHKMFILYSMPIGLGLGYLIAHILANIYSPLQFSFLDNVLLALLVSCAETLFFQGLLQNATEKMSEPIIAIVFTALVYTLFHTTHIMQVNLIFFAESIILSTFYFAGKNIYASIIASFIMNFTFYYFTHSIFAVPFK